MHGEVADLVLGEPALADAPRGDGGGNGEAHDDQQAGRQRDDSQREIGEFGSRRLIHHEGVDAGDLAVVHRRDKGEA